MLVFSLTGMPGLSWAEKERPMSHGKDVQHFPSVGPGDAPHVHELPLDRLMRVEDISKSPDQLPPPIQRDQPGTVHYTLEAREVIAPLAEGVDYAFWTYNGTVPGPLLRARQGDTVRLTLSNHKTSTHKHSIDLHAVTGPGGGAGLTLTEPGQTKTISFRVLQPGVYVYHCASPNVPTHITNGLYGLIVVDPKEGWSKVDREFYVMQGEFYTHGDLGEKGFQPFSAEKMMRETPDYIVLNGRVRALSGTGALKAKQGETIRIFIGNAGVSKISSFHIIGEIMDRVYPEASLGHFHTGVQTTLIPAGGAAVVELKLENAGTFILLDHAISRIDRGAYGLLEVEGTGIPDLLAPLSTP